MGDTLEYIEANADASGEFFTDYEGIAEQIESESAHPRKKKASR